MNAPILHLIVLVLVIESAISRTRTMDENEDDGI
jgi:hypothetical protein